MIACIACTYVQRVCKTNLKWEKKSTYVRRDVGIWYIDACMYVRTYVYMYVCTYYVYMYVCMYICTYVRTYVRMYVHTYEFMYVYMYVHTYVHTYIKMYVHTPSAVELFYNGELGV